MKRFFSVKYGFVSISIVLGVLIAVTIACDDPDVAQSISDGRDRAGQALSEEQALTGAINTLRQEIEGTILPYDECGCYTSFEVGMQASLDQLDAADTACYNANNSIQLTSVAFDNAEAAEDCGVAVHYAGIGNAHLDDVDLYLMDAWAEYYGALNCWWAEQQNYEDCLTICEMP